MLKIKSSFILLACFIGSAVAGDLVPSFVLDFLEESGIQRESKYANSFEAVEDFDGHYIVPQNHKGTASHTLDKNKVTNGGFSHKGWLYGHNRKGENHRAYPTFQMKKTDLGIVDTLVLIEIDVWVDVDLKAAPDEHWFSLATYTSYADQYWSRSYLVNIDKDYRLHLMHVPEHDRSQPDIFQTKELALPRSRWVRLTTLIDYSKENRFYSPIIAVWQGDELVSASRFNDRINPYNIDSSDYPKCLNSWAGASISEAEELCGLHYKGGLAQMHFGLYAPPFLSRGEVYNDHLVVTKLRRN